MFAKHHYLSHSHNNAAHVYAMFANDELAGFMSVLHFPHPHIKNMKKAHRTVLLPDYQGVGLGIFLNNWVAEHWVKKGFRFASVTSNPAMIMARKKQKKWKLKSKGRKSSGSVGGIIHNKNIKGSTSANRITTSWEYVM